MLTQISGLSGSNSPDNHTRILLRCIPPRKLLFDPVRDSYGSRLAISFGNENREGSCPFYGHQCFHCDIGKGEGRFDISLNQDRLLYFEAHYGNALRNVEHLIVYNSGSALNSNELSDETLKHILNYAKSLENCKVISFDSREMYVIPSRLDLLIANLKADQHPRAIIGIETQSDDIRVKLLRKAMSKASIEKAFRTVSTYKARIGIDANVLFQPPGVWGQTAIEEAVKTVSYLLELKERHNLSLDINFHPYYPSRIGISKFPNHPRANVEDAVAALIGISDMLRRNSPDSQLFIGWQDEGYDTEQERRADELRVLMGKFNRFNISQDPTVLSST